MGITSIIEKVVVDQVVITRSVDPDAFCISCQGITRDGIIAAHIIERDTGVGIIVYGIVNNVVIVRISAPDPIEIIVDNIPGKGVVVREFEKDPVIYLAVVAQSGAETRVVPGEDIIVRFEKFDAANIIAGHIVPRYVSVI